MIFLRLLCEAGKHIKNNIERKSYNNECNLFSVYHFKRQLITNLLHDIQCLQLSLRISAKLAGIKHY